MTPRKPDIQSCSGLCYAFRSLRFLGLRIILFAEVMQKDSHHDYLGACLHPERQWPHQYAPSRHNLSERLFHVYPMGWREKIERLRILVLHGFPKWSNQIIAHHVGLVGGYPILERYGLHIDVPSNMELLQSHAVVRGARAHDQNGHKLVLTTHERQCRYFVVRFAEPKRRGVIKSSGFVQRDAQPVYSSNTPRECIYLLPWCRKSLCSFSQLFMKWRKLFKLQFFQNQCRPWYTIM